MEKEPHTARFAVGRVRTSVEPMIALSWAGGETSNDLLAHGAMMMI